MFESGMSIDELFAKLENGQAGISKDLLSFGYKLPLGPKVVSYLLDRESLMAELDLSVEEDFEIIRLARLGNRILCGVRAGGVFTDRYIIASKPDAVKEVDSSYWAEVAQMLDQLFDDDLHGFDPNQRKVA